MELREACGIEDLFGTRVARFGDTGRTPTPPNLISCLFEHYLVCGVFPQDQFLDDSEESLAFIFLSLSGRKQFGVSGRIVNHLREYDRAGSCKRPTRPPQMNVSRLSNLHELF